jgi:hypothetical protein
MSPTIYRVVIEPAIIDKATAINEPAKGEAGSGR